MKIGSEKLKIFFDLSKRAVWTICLHAFWFIVFLIMIEIALGNLIFYTYVTIPQKTAPEVNGNIIKFNIGEFKKAAQKINLQESQSVYYSGNLEQQ